MNDFEQVKARINIIDVIRSEASGQIRKVGLNTFNLEACPFCGGHDCFRIFTNSQTFHCFQCNEGNNVFHFIAAIRRIDLYQALQHLASTINYQLQNTKPETDEFICRQKIFTVAADYYHQALLNHTKALTWLSEKRGHTLQTVKEFKIGWSGRLKNNLYKYLRSCDFKDDAILSSGLVKNRDGDISDFLPANVYIYPHFINTKASHFTFKDPRKKLQYQIPNQFKLNGHLFYGQNALYHDSIVLVEGENDRITIMRITSEKNVAAMIGQISEEQIEYLKIHARNKLVYLCFDNDAAGLKYTNKMVFALSGIAIVRIIRFDKGKDIDDYLRQVKTDPGKEYYRLLENAIDAIQFQIECLPDETDIIKISRLLEPVLNNIAKIDDDILVEGYLKMIMEKYPKSILRPALRSKLAKLRSDVQFDRTRNKDAPKDNFGLIEHDNCYFKKSAEGSTVKISDFIIKLRKIFVFEDELQYEFILKNNKNQVSLPITFSPEERAGLQQFRQKCIGQGSFYFYGNQPEVYRIMQYEEKQANIQEVIHFIQKYGWIPEHNIWLFENCAVKNGKVYPINDDGIIKIDNKGFKARDVLVYSGDMPVINFEQAEEDFKLLVIENFRRMIDGEDKKSFKSFIALGFVATCAYLPEIVREFKCMPFFFPFGPSGTGKSAITALLLSFFGLDGRSEPWGEATPDGTFKFIEHLSCLPVWYDEFSNLTSSKQEKMILITKNIYNRIGHGKGGLKKRQISIVNGSLWISGEDSPAEKGLLSRCVIIRLLEITKYKDIGYRWLMANQSQFSTIFVDLIKRKNKKMADELIGWIKKLVDHLRKDGHIDNRTAVNYAIPAAAFWLFNYHDMDREYIVFLDSETSKDKQRKEDEDILLKFYEDISYMINNGITRETIHVDIMEKKIYICFNEIYSDWIKELKKRGETKLFKKTTILDYIKHKEYYFETENNRHYWGDIRKRVIVLDLDKVPEEIKDYFDYEKK